MGVEVGLIGGFGPRSRPQKLGIVKPDIFMATLAFVIAVLRVKNLLGLLRITESHERFF